MWERAKRRARESDLTAMLVARVIGNAFATLKHRSMDGAKLLLVQPLRSMTCEPLLVPDRLGATAGDMVLITSDGRGARAFMGDDKTPVRWTLVGIIDDDEVENIR